MSSDVNDDGISQQLEAICQRLILFRTSLREALEDRTEAQSILGAELQRILEELQAVQMTIQQRSSLTELFEVERLQTSLQQKEVLLREIHHRVKNNLQIFSSLLDLQVMRTDDPSVQELLRSNQSRVNSIGLVHERLSQASDLTEISLGDYVQGLVVTLVRVNAIDPNQIALRIQADPNIQVLADRAIPIGLILHELISNALKHGLQGRGGEIFVELNQNFAGQATLGVSDSANRLSADFDPNATDSLGFQLINSLVQQLSGTLQIERGTQTTVRVRFNIFSDR
ncbi:MAG: sensor histidine kinase [Myxacorys californica WJT36-NPBG1]|jgi:two-component sensor histidine kinase|nr:sensor histidine kinase [Myxacorys californica WJT36-NPBG1]